MGNDLDRTLARRLGRRDFLKLGAGLAAGSGLLAACGGAEDPEQATPAAPTPPGSPAPAAEPERPPIGEEPGELQVFEWAGYEYPTYGGKGAKGVLQPYVDQFGKPKYQFLTSDDQALGKVRAGFRFDVVHPCVGYVPDWIQLDAVQPFDTSLLSNFQNLNPAMVKAGQIDGEQYLIPADWGFASVLYRGDKVEAGEESWSLLYDERYAGKISWWESPLENFVIWGYVNGVANPWDMTDSELEDAKKFLTEKKKLVRNFWSSYTDLNADVASGNVWISYAWQDAWLTARNEGLDVVYAEPTEGRLSWLCGFMLGKDTENYRHAHEYVDAWSGVPSAEWSILNYAYGHANTAVDLSKLSPELVQAFRLEDPAVLEEPKTHMDRYVARRRAYAKAWDEVKAA